MLRFRRSVLSAKWVIVLGCCALLFFISSTSALADDRQDDAITMVAKTLDRLGEKDLANRLLADYANGRVNIKDLGGFGVNAETGQEGIFDSKNVMTLDDDILSQTADQKRLWEKRPYGKSLNTVGWATTVFHEYVHMDQASPENTPTYEDPAWQQTDQALARWYEHLRNEFEGLKNEPASSLKEDKLQELEDLLRHLQSQSASLKEGIDRNIGEGKLSQGMTWKCPELFSKTDIFQDLKSEIEQNKTALQSAKSAASAGTVFPNEPFNGMQITYNINGASITGTTDSSGFTVSRQLSGSLESGQLHISGLAKMGNGFGADLSVVVTVGKDSKDFNAYIETGFPDFNEQPFDLSVPIPGGASAGNFTISMTGHYNAGTRGLVVSGNFSANPAISNNSGTGTSGADNIRVEVNGHNIDFDVPPVIVNGRTLVPVRKVADALGCTTNWDPSGYVTVENNNAYIYFEINNNVAYVDGEEYLLDVPPMIIGDRSLLPLRFVSEALGLKVDWDDYSRLITISAD